MAGQTPFFMSGPRLKIKVDGQTIAYAVGLDLRVSRNVQIVNVLGSYASVALQATAYNGVSGSMQIVRLMDKTSAQSNIAEFNKQNEKKDTENWTGVAPLTGVANNSIVKGSSTSNSVISASENLIRHLDPESVLASSTFDIEVWQMYPTETVLQTVATKEQPSTPILKDGNQQRAGGLNNSGVLVKHFTIQNCRLNSRSASISAGQLLTESFSFTGTLLVSDDRHGGETEASDAINASV